MDSISNNEEVNSKTIDNSLESTKRLSFVMLKRFFSDGSATSTTKYTYTLYPPYNYDYSLYARKDFLFKIAQILVSVACVGLYSDGIPQHVEYSLSSLLFPNVVFSTSIIITSVIALGYALGQVMPEVLIRIFNTLAVILFLSSACLTGKIWYDVSGSASGKCVLRTKLLLTQVFMSILNVVLYSVDLGLSMKKSLSSA